MMAKGFGCNGTALSYGEILSPLASKASASAREVVGKVWLDGSFSIGYRNSEERALTLNTHTNLKAEEYDREELGRYVEALRSVGLSDARNPHNSRPETYGRKGITGNGKRMVACGATYLQRSYGKDQLSFLTLTVPELPFEDLQKIASKWGELQRQLGQWLRRKLASRGLPQELVSCTELQPKRLKSGSIGCLHVHCLFVGRKRKGAWAVTPKMCRKWWLGALSRIVGYKVESRSCENLKRVQKSASAYLSKYMSKGSKDVQEFADIAGWECVPRQWWNMSKALRDAVYSCVVQGRHVGEALESLARQWIETGEAAGIRFARWVRVELPNGDVFRPGLWGTVTKSMYDDLFQCQNEMWGIIHL